jgi:2-methylcitrate dehydratase PrpD
MPASRASSADSTESISHSASAHGVNSTASTHPAPGAQSAHAASLHAAAAARATLPSTHEASAAARLIFLDTIGCMLAGREAPEVLAFEEHLSSMESGPFTFPGGRRLSTNAAAQVGAMAATWDEACEGHALAHGRPGVALVAALLPLALARDAGYDETIDALALGYEVGARAGAWLRIKPGMHVDGFWPALGVAAGCARLLGLDAARISQAIDIAACQLGMSQYLPVTEGRTARNTYLAQSATLGLLAAHSAAAQITVPAGALDWVAQQMQLAETSAPIAPEVDLIPDAYLKPYAAVRHVHYGAELAKAARDEFEGVTKKISQIELSIYREALTYCSNRAPATILQAQFSLSFGIAAMLRYGVLDATVYRPDRFNDSELRRLEALVVLSEDRALSDARKRGASLAVKAGSKEFERDVRSITGDTDKPMSAEEVAAKFMRYAQGRVPHEKGFLFANVLLASDNNLKLRALWELLF